MTLLAKIKKLIRRIKYYQVFNKLACIKGLNPDKHSQVFESYFLDSETKIYKK